MREVKADMAYRMLAYVILDDHFHWLIHLEDGRALSRIMQALKLRYARRYKRDHRLASGLTLWQRRFWDHHIRDESDMRRHMDYIHYNPVKHGYVAIAARYRWSSLAAWVERGAYPEDWGAEGVPSTLDGVESE